MVRSLSEFGAPPVVSSVQIQLYGIPGSLKMEAVNPGGDETLHPVMIPPK